MTPISLFNQGLACYRTLINTDPATHNEKTLKSIDQGNQDSVSELFRDLAPEQIALLPVVENEHGEEYLALIAFAMFQILEPGYVKKINTVSHLTEVVALPPSKATLRNVFLNLINFSQNKLVAEPIRRALLMKIREVNEQRAFEDLDLSYLDLSGINLSPEAMWTELEIKPDNHKQFLFFLCRATFTGTNLCGSNLTNVGLVKAKLTNVSLDGAVLNNINLFEAELQNVTITNAMMMNATAIHATIINVNLSKTDLSDTRLIGCTLKMVNMCKAILIKAVLNMSTFDDVDMTEADLSLHTTFFNATLTNVDVTDAKITRNRFLGAIVKNMRGYDREAL